MYIYGFCKNHQCILYRINGMPDHIHMLVGIHPTISVATFVHDLKISTNNYMTEHREQFPMFKKWSEGYCALTYSAREKEQVMRYIINQKEHHHKLTAREELILILNEAGIEFDERFL
jgi:REP element-mobilizing transposase RayT